MNSFNALNTINKLKPQLYDKSTYIPEDGQQPEETRREAGLIAQEVIEVPELAQFVKPEGTKTEHVPPTEAEQTAIDETYKALEAQKKVQKDKEDELKQLREAEEPDEAPVTQAELEAQLEIEKAKTADLDALHRAAQEAGQHPDKSVTTPMSLDYNSIFTHLIKAVQELDTIVKTQAAEIEILKNK